MVKIGCFYIKSCPNPSFFRCFWTILVQKWRKLAPFVPAPPSFLPLFGQKKHPKGAFLPKNGQKRGIKAGPYTRVMLGAAWLCPHQTLKRLVGRPAGTSDTRCTDLIRSRTRGTPLRGVSRVREAALGLCPRVRGSPQGSSGPSVTDRGALG